MTSLKFHTETIPNMKTLSEIKDQVSQEAHGIDFCMLSDKEKALLIDNVSKAYAAEVTAKIN